MEPQPSLPSASGLGCWQVSAASCTQVRTCMGLCLHVPLAECWGLGPRAHPHFQIPLLISDPVVGPRDPQHPVGVAYLGALQGSAGTCPVTLWVGAHVGRVVSDSPRGFLMHMCFCLKLLASFFQKWTLMFHLMLHPSCNMYAGGRQTGWSLGVRKMGFLPFGRKCVQSG